MGELFPRIGFIVTNSKLEAHKVITIYNGRAEIENRIKEGKNTLRRDKTKSRRRFAGQSGKASRRMSCLQSAPHDPGYGVLGRESQAVHRLDHQTACEGWGQGGVSYLAEEVYVMLRRLFH